VVTTSCGDADTSSARNFIRWCVIHVIACMMTRKCLSGFTVSLLVHVCASCLILALLQLNLFRTGNGDDLKEMFFHEHNMH
jgi:hypothetical protein